MIENQKCARNRTIEFDDLQERPKPRWKVEPDAWQFEPTLWPR